VRLRFTLARLAALPFTKLQIDPAWNAAWIGMRGAISVSQLAFDLAPSALPCWSGLFFGRLMHIKKAYAETGYCFDHVLERALGERQ